jgi:hypothetical protein
LVRSAAHVSFLPTGRAQRYTGGRCIAPTPHRVAGELIRGAHHLDTDRE